MPIAGSIGAISAGRRNAAAHRRQGSGPTHSYSRTQIPGLVQKMPPVQVPSRDPVPVKSNEFSETASVTSTASKSSVLSMFKKQVEETGGFFKKKQQAFAVSVKKTLSVAVDAVTVQSQSTVTSDSGASKGSYSMDFLGFHGPHDGTKTVTPPVAAAESKLQQPLVSAHLAETKRKNEEWTAALKQMGFEQWDITEAISKLGGSPKSMEDILEVLVARQPASPSMASSVSTSSDTFVVNLRKLPSDRIGISVDTSDSKQIIVDSVSGGLVQRWNAANPYLQVKVGARILDVNNTRGTVKEMVDVLLHASSLSLLVKPGPPAVVASSAASSSAASSSSSSGSAGPQVKRDQRRVSFSDDISVISRGKSAFARAFVESASDLPPLPPPLEPAPEDDENEWEIVTSSSTKAFEFEPAARETAEVKPVTTSPPSSPTLMAHVMVTMEEAEVMDFAANVVEMAFARASEKVLKETAVSKPTKKIVEEHSSARSPVIGGA